MRFLADENFNNDILRGVRKALGENVFRFDVIRVQDTDAYQADDAVVLTWAAKEQRILLTHDAKTMPRPAYERIAASQSMPGVFIVDNLAPIGEVIDELVMLIGASDAAEWQNRIFYLPMR